MGTDWRLCSGIIDTDFYFHKLHTLRQTSTVELYRKQFTLLRCLVAARHPFLDEAYFVSCCLKGLKEEVQSTVQSCRPSSVEASFNIARLKEYCLSEAKQTSPGVSRTTTLNSIVQVEAISVPDSLETTLVSDFIPSHQGHNEVAAVSSTLEPSLRNGPSHTDSLSSPLQCAMVPVVIAVEARSVPQLQTLTSDVCYDGIFVAYVEAAPKVLPSDKARETKILQPMQCQIEELNGNFSTKEGTVTKVATTHMLRSAPLRWDKYQIHMATSITTLSSNRIPKALTVTATHSALPVVDIHNKFFREPTIYVESWFLGSSGRPPPATDSPFTSMSNHKGHLSNVHYMVKYPCICFKTVHSHSAISHGSVAVPGDVFPRKGEHNIAMPLQTPTLPGYYFSDFIAPMIVYKQFLFSCLQRPTFSHGISSSNSVGFHCIVISIGEPAGECIWCFDPGIFSTQVLLLVLRGIVQCCVLLPWGLYSAEFGYHSGQRSRSYVGLYFSIVVWNRISQRILFGVAALLFSIFLTAVLYILSSCSYAFHDLELHFSIIVNTFRALKCCAGRDTNNVGIAMSVHSLIQGHMKLAIARCKRRFQSSLGCGTGFLMFYATVQVGSTYYILDTAIQALIRVLICHAMLLHPLLLRIGALYTLSGTSGQCTSILVFLICSLILLTRGVDTNSSTRKDCRTCFDPGIFQLGCAYSVGTPVMQALGCTSFRTIPVHSHAISLLKPSLAPWMELYLWKSNNFTPALQNSGCNYSDPATYHPRAISNGSAYSLQWDYYHSDYSSQLACIVTLAVFPPMLVTVVPTLHNQIAVIDPFFIKTISYLLAVTSTLCYQFCTQDVWPATTVSPSYDTKASIVSSEKVHEVHNSNLGDPGYILGKSGTLTGSTAFAKMSSLVQHFKVLFSNTVSPSHTSDLRGGSDGIHIRRDAKFTVNSCIDLNTVIGGDMMNANALSYGTFFYVSVWDTGGTDLDILRFSVAARTAANVPARTAEEHPLYKVLDILRTKFFFDDIAHIIQTATPDLTLILLWYFHLCGIHARGELGGGPKDIPDHLGVYFPIAAKVFPVHSGHLILLRKAHVAVNLDHITVRSFYKKWLVREHGYIVCLCSA